MTWLSEHWLDLFGWIGSALLIVSLLQTRVLRFRLLNLAASFILVVFNALLAGFAYAVIRKGGGAHERQEG